MSDLQMTTDRSRRPTHTYPLASAFLAHLFGFCLLPFGSFPDSSVDKESSCNAGDLGLIHGLERSPGEGRGYLLQYPGLENSMDLYSPQTHKESDPVE